MFETDPVCGMKVLPESAVHTATHKGQNLFSVLVYNSLGIPVAAGVLFPVFRLLLKTP